MESSGFLSLVLHAHLPYIRHPEDDTILEEEWLYEAITETYIPLIQTFFKLSDEGIDFKLTLSLSPPLISMLADELLQKRYLNYLDRLIELSNKEVKRTQDSQFYKVAKMYQQKFIAAKNFFEKYNHNLIDAFKDLMEKGVLEIITSSATHSYLPLMALYPEAVKAQIKIGIDCYKKHFNRQPAGLWLPECGYYPNHDQYLWDEEIRYFITDNHAILHATPKVDYANFAPIYCPSGVAAFGRDLESSLQVWSSQKGYPGDYDYREFYRDIGFDLDYDYIKEYIHREGFRKQTGMKYYKITGETNHKEIYQPKLAKKKAALHAQDFIENRKAQINYLNQKMDRKAIVVSPYDAELFGHWWYEGPIWLENLIKKIYKTEEIELITPSQYLDKYPVNQVATPSLSSWGNGGYNEVWLDESNDWIYPKLYQITEKMIKLANNFKPKNNLELRTLKQLARELLLAQSSDWAFILKTDTTTEYATKRIKNHINNFKKLAQGLEENQNNESYLKKLEDRNNIFPNLDYRIYSNNYQEVNN